MRKAKALLLFILLALGVFAPETLAQGLPAFSSTPAPGGGQSYTLSIQTLVALTALTFLPAVLLMMTGFTRIIIVLSLLRSALGTQSTPPNQVLVGLALFLTMYVMSPVLERSTSTPTCRGARTRSPSTTRWCAPNRRSRASC